MNSGCEPGQAPDGDFGLWIKLHRTRNALGRLGSDQSRERVLSSLSQEEERALEGLLLKLLAASQGSAYA